MQTSTKTSIEHKPIDQAIEKARDYLLQQQYPAGYWMGTLEADPSVTAGYVPLMHFMGNSVESKRTAKIVASLRRKQNSDGSWSAYFGGPGDVSVTVQVYFGLKMAGVSPDEEYMRRARDFVRAGGGVTHTNLITRIWLALFGQFDWLGVPSIPPEIIFLPRWIYLNIYECSSWARATIMAMALLSVRRPVCQIPESAKIDELYIETKGQRLPEAKPTPLISWQRFFTVADRLFKMYQNMPLKPLRGFAMKRVEKWVVEHQDTDGSWGGIMLPWIYSLFALKDLGYTPDHPVIKSGLAALEDFIVDDDEFLLEPAVSPVWDTAWAIIALRDSGLPGDHPSLVKAARWLLGKQITYKGDWAIKNPNTKPGAWAFEFENRYYPDIDDTAVVSRALSLVKLSEAEEHAKSGAIHAGVQWVIDMQSKDGGWAAFDRDNNRKVLAYIPFADFITPLDPPSPDVTAHAVEMLGMLQPESHALKKALDYLKNSQEIDGPWYGRWGVNYVYGAGLILPSLKMAGQDMTGDWVKKAVYWLESCQRPDSGWGESCRSYDDSTLRGQGESTASQTAWALIGLIAAGETSGEEVKQGINYLLRNQQEDGAWEEAAFTGTGFPRAFYLRYDLYRIYFPLMALARYRAAMEEQK